MNNNFPTKILISVICALFILPQSTYAQIDSQPELSAIYNADNEQRALKLLPADVTIIKQSANDLLGKGCKLVDLDSTGAPTVKKESGHQYFAPKDAKTITKNSSNGQKLNFKQYYSCDKVASEFFLSSQPRDLPWYLDALVGIFDVLFWMLDWIVNFAMYLIAELFMPLITQGTFIQNDIVKAGWPFVQGIANLGFIFALLYIALATTLRLESVSTSIQRLLPKLLIGALLVNFSLVIGGLVIDASRLMMATEIKLAAGPGVTSKNFYDKLLKATRGYELTGLSGLGGVVTGSGAGASVSNYDYAIGYIMVRARTTVLSGMLTVGLFLISINLLVRYIALLILLTFSPLAYVAIALPQTKQYFTQWWQLFIKWVMYGPIVLFFLILILKIQSTGFATIPKKGFLGELVHFFIVVALLFIGHSVSKKAAGIGSDAVMGFAKKNPRTAVAGLAAFATGGLAAPLLAAALTSRNARSFGKQLLPQRFRESIYDKDGNVKKGKKNAGMLAADSVKSFLSPTQRKNAREANEENLLVSGARKTGATYTPTISSAKLTNASFVAQLDKESLSALMTYVDPQDPTKGLKNIKALGAAISGDKDGTIGKDQIKSLIETLDLKNAQGQLLTPMTHRDALLSSITQNVKIVQGLGEKEIDKIIEHGNPTIAQNLYKSLATEKKE